MVDTVGHAGFNPARSRRVVDTTTLISSVDTFISSVAVAEAVSVVLAALIAKLAYIDIFLGQSQPTLPYVSPALLLVCTLYLFLKQAGLYTKTAFDQSSVAYGKILGSHATSFLVLLGVMYVLKLADWYSRGWLLTWFALSGSFIIAVRLAGTQYLQNLIASGAVRQRIAMFGTPEFLEAMKSRVESSASSAAVAGVYADGVGECEADALEIVGDLQDLTIAMQRKVFDTVIVGLPGDRSDDIKFAINRLVPYTSELLLCTKLDADPIVVQGSREIGALRADVVNLVPLSESNRLLKAAVDYVVSALALVLLAPFMVLVAIAIKIDSPGPVFFRQRRYGQNNRIFRIFKFRTMTVAEDGEHVAQAKPHDHRVTRIGRLLRRTSIDELPQLINVLVGDMSIVGPRPHALAHDHQFEKQLDFFSRRRRVRPGLTGWAQVHGLRGETHNSSDIIARAQHDFYYIDNWSIWLDIEIIIRTIFVFSRGAY